MRLEDGPRLEDSFGRRLAYVYDPSGNSIDVQLIAAGYAKAWTRDGQHRDMFVGLEANAKANKAGCLWRTVGNASSPTSTTAPVPTAIVVHVPTMVDYTFAVGSDAVSGAFGSAIRRLFPEYASVWLVAVAVGELEPTQQSFVSFVRSHSSTNDLGQRAKDLIPVITAAERSTTSSSLGKRIVNPANQTDADIGCLISVSAARLKYSSFVIDNFDIGAESCDERFLDYQVKVMSREVGSSWIQWISDWYN